MPEPSRLVLLEQLPTIPSGTKIRLLGCLHSHHASEAKLVLRDKYPVTNTGAATAVVSIENILENVNHELLQVGSWVNIMGNVRTLPVDSARRSKSSKDLVKSSEASHSTTVEATMIWSAGAIKRDKYKSATQEYQKLHSVD